MVFGLPEKVTNIMSICIGQFECDLLPNGRVLQELNVSRKPLVDLPNSPKGYDTVLVKMDRFAALTMFAERGLYSGHVYQPEVNHRQMNFTSFYKNTAKPGGNIPPMIDSMLNPTPHNSFSMGNLMSFYFYEVEAATDENVERLTTPAAICVHKNTRLNGCVRGYRYRPVTRQGWNRTLMLFGFQVKESISESDHVSVHEIGSFLEMLGSYDLRKNSGLKKLIKERRMSWLYTVDDDKGEYPEKLNEFFSYVRALVPLRVAAYDGRHRFSLCCYFATGYFKPRPEITMDFITFSDAFKGGNKDDKNEFAKCAVFRSQSIYVSQGKSTVKKSNLLSLCKSGVTTTASQGYLVETTWTTLIPEFVEYLIKKNVDLKLFTYANYWAAVADGGDKNVAGRLSEKKKKKAASVGDVQHLNVEASAVISNIQKVWKAFTAFLNKASATRLNLVIGTSAVKERCLVLAVAKGKPFTLQLGKGLKLHPTTNVPKELGIFSAIVRLLCDDIRCFVRLRDLISDRKCSFPQSDIGDKEKGYFTTMDFLGRWLFGTSNMVCDHLETRYLVEKVILYELIKADKHAAVAKDLDAVSLDDGVPLSFENMGKSKTILTDLKRKVLSMRGSSRTRMKDKMTLAEQEPTYLTETKFAITPVTTKMTAKTRFACQSVIFRDLMDGVIELGPNPFISLKGNNNHMLQLYLR
jgi:hypothetical protein